MSNIAEAQKITRENYHFYSSWQISADMYRSRSMVPGTNINHFYIFWNDVNNPNNNEKKKD